MNWKIFSIILLCFLIVSNVFNSIQFSSGKECILVDVDVLDMTGLPSVNVTTFNPDNNVLDPVRKSGRYENYSNDDVRKAICYASRYTNDEDLFRFEHPTVYVLWKDYQSRVVNASYCYWVISYAFNI